MAASLAALKRSACPVEAQVLVDIWPTYNMSPTFTNLDFPESNKSPTVGPTERTRKYPEYLMSRSQLTERGPLVRSHSILDGLK